MNSDRTSILHHYLITRRQQRQQDEESMKSLPRSRRKQQSRFSISARKLGLLFLVFVAIYSQLLRSFLQTQEQRLPPSPPSPPSQVDQKLRQQQKRQQLDSPIQKKSNTALTIGIASTITECGPYPFIDGAAVLKYSIDQTSIHGPKGGKYDYKLYILYHPNATECVLPLKALGFELLERPTPVNVSDIEGDVLRERITTNGCCGEKELIKLEAFRLTEHPIVVHLDLDVLVLQPMDDVLDFMLDPNIFDIGKTPIMYPERTLPAEIDLVFTKDYNIVSPRRRDKPFQGGFFMVKPSLETYQEMVAIVREGDYRDEEQKGWGGKVGPFHGGMTIQGLLPWYYEYLHPNRALELNRCVYNNIADNPTNERTKNDIPQGKCQTNQEKCEDCRARPFEEIVTFHFTICLKPWMCEPQKQNKIQMRLCRRALHEWFVYRSRMEQMWGRNGTGPGRYDRDHNMGYCSRSGEEGYRPIPLPYGKPLEVTEE